MDDRVRLATTPDLADIDFSSVDGIRPILRERHRALFGPDDGYIDEYLDLVGDLFAGRFPGLQAVDTHYHDISHTLQATLCLSELVVNRDLGGDPPPIDARGFRIALVAILFHDLGYLKTLEDTEGTGAKYTHIHEKRSCAYARSILGARGWSDHDLCGIENIISGTGPLSDVSKIPFQDDGERLLGQMVCSADYVGQMSDPDYPDKLRVLFEEFEESFRYRGMPAEDWPFRSYEALLRGTPGFWSHFVEPKMTVECDGVWRYLENPRTGVNVYLDAIAANLDIIGSRIELLDAA